MKGRRKFTNVEFREWSWIIDIMRLGVSLTLAVLVSWLIESSSPSQMRQTNLVN